MAHDSTGHDHAHDDHDDDHHEEPALPEPTTPGWLTLLGACLFLLGGIFLVFASSDSDAAADSTEKAPAAATATAPLLRPGMLPLQLQQHDEHDGHGHLATVRVPMWRQQRASSRCLEQHETRALSAFFKIGRC